MIYKSNEDKSNHPITLKSDWPLSRMLQVKLLRKERLISPTHILSSSLLGFLYVSWEGWTKTQGNDARKRLGLKETWDVLGRFTAPGFPSDYSNLAHLFAPPYNHLSVFQSLPDLHTDTGYCFWWLPTLPASRPDSACPTQKVCLPSVWISTWTVILTLEFD